MKSFLKASSNKQQAASNKRLTNHESWIIRDLDLPGGN